MSDSHHPILEQPWSWEITHLEWMSAEGGSPPWYLDMTLTRDGVSRRLRFVQPQDVTLELDGGFPQQCGDMVILDIRARQLSGLTVQVTEGGASGSPVYLYAQSVLELDSD